MALLDDLQDPNLLTTKVGGTCMACKFIGGLTPAESEKFVELMGDRTVPKTAIARILAKNGHRIPVSALTRHARGECLGDVTR